MQLSMLPQPHLLVFHALLEGSLATTCGKHADLSMQVWMEKRRVAHQAAAHISTSVL